MSTEFKPSATPARPGESPPSGLKLGDVYYILFRHQWLILICSLLGILAGGGIYFLKTPPYESEAKLLVKYVRDTKAFEAGPGSQVDVRSPDYRGENIINTEIDILTSRDLALDVADAVGPDKVLALAGGGTNREAAAAMILRGLQPEVGKKSSVIGITFRHPDPLMAQTILRQLVQSYLRKHTEVHRAAGLFDEMLTKQADNYRSRLNTSEDQMQKLLAKAGFASVEEGQKHVDQQIAQIQQALVTAQSDLAQHKAILEKLQRDAGVSQAADTNAQPAAVEAPLDPAKEQQYQNVVARLDALRKREMDLLLQFTPESRDVKEVRELIAGVEKTKRQLEEEEPRLFRQARRSASVPAVGSVLAAGRAETWDLTVEQTQVISLEARIKNLTDALNSARAQAATLNTLAREAADLQIRKKEDETRYLYFSTSLDQARIDESLGVTATPGIQIVEEATAPIVDKQKIRKLALMVLCGGIGMGLGLAFLLEMFIDPRIKRPVDVEQKLRVPLFLFIPDFSRNGHAKALKANGSPSPVVAALTAGVASTEESKSDLPVLAANPLATYYEALRDRLIMYFEIREMTHKPKLVGVTGASRKAGASSIAAGLAERMSEMGEGNVLLVDMNPQHGPSVYPFHRGKPGCGLNEALEQEQRETAQVQDNLYVVSLQGDSRNRVGIVPKRFASLMPKMKASDYDYIIFDMPPVSQTSVTAKVAGLLDMTFLVVESERTNVDQAKRCAALLAESRANVTAILNRYHDYLPARLSADI